MQTAQKVDQAVIKDVENVEVEYVDNDKNINDITEKDLLDTFNSEDNF